MKNIVAAGVMSMVLLTACKKNDQVAEKSLDQQKMEFQARQLDIEKQKLAIEKEKMAYEAQKKADSVAQAKTAAAAKPTVVHDTKTVYVNNTPSPSSSAATGTSDAGQTAPQKQGMSKAAKGTIIGAVGGAAAGALINKKNRAAGAVVGGVVGGAGGYVIGRSQDKKDGRVK